MEPFRDSVVLTEIVVRWCRGKRRIESDICRSTPNHHHFRVCRLALTLLPPRKRHGSAQYDRSKFLNAICETRSKSGQGLLTVQEASHYLGISVSTLYGWVYQRRIPFVKVGRALRFDPRDLEAFVEAHKQHPWQESSRSVSHPARCYNTRAAGKG